MPRLAVSMDESQFEWIEEQSESLDESMAAVVRRLIDRGREDESLLIHGSNHDSRSDSPAGLRDRVGELEERLADLEAAGVDTDSETAPTASRERDHERGEKPADPVATGDAGGHEAAASDEADTGEGVDVIEAAIERAAEGWGDGDDRTEQRKAAARAVLGALREEPMSRSEIVDEFADEYAVAGQNEDTWWRKNLAECSEAPLKALATYDRGSQKWRWAGAE